MAKSLRSVFLFLLNFFLTIEFLNFFYNSFIKTGECFGVRPRRRKDEDSKETQDIFEKTRAARVSGNHGQNTELLRCPLTSLNCRNKERCTRISGVTERR